MEKNRTTLQNALKQMRQYAPPVERWEGVLADLDTPITDETGLTDGLRKLPEYTPPPAVWNNLAQQLNIQQEQSRKLWVRRMRVLAAAAVLTLATGVAWWLFYDSAATVRVVYGQETVQQFALDIDWTADDDSFNSLMAQLQDNNDPTVNELRLELEELNSARADVETMLKSYGADPQLVTQLGDIERERSEVYRQIIEVL